MLEIEKRASKELFGTTYQSSDERKHMDAKNDEDDDKDYAQTFPPPANYIKISQGEIQLVQSRSFNDPHESHSHKDKTLKVLEDRVVDLEDTLFVLQEKLKNSQCKSISFESDFRKQLDSLRLEEHKPTQPCRDYKTLQNFTLQTQFERQEMLLHTLQQENKALIVRIHQYESCLDDIMRKVVNAIDSEDNLREEITILKSRVRLLETQNAALSAISPVKGRDEGYCTMSNGQPQPLNTPLEDLPEELEKWLPKDEPFLAELEDWTMSQEELVVMPLDDEHDHEQGQLQQSNGEQQQQQQKQDAEDDWLWHSNLFDNSKEYESNSLDNDELPQQKIVYSEDEEVVCSEFTDDFYKLVNIPTSQHSLFSYVHCETDDDESNASGICASTFDKKHQQQPSRTPSEAGLAQVTSCSSSSEDFSSYRKLDICDNINDDLKSEASACTPAQNTQDCKSTMLYLNSEQRLTSPNQTMCKRELQTKQYEIPTSNCEVQEHEHIMQDAVMGAWYKSNSWKRVNAPPATKSTVPVKIEKNAESNQGNGGIQKVSFCTKIPMCTYQFQATSANKQQHKSKIPPPVPVRRSFRT